MAEAKSRKAAAAEVEDAPPDPAVEAAEVEDAPPEPLRFGGHVDYGDGRGWVAENTDLPEGEGH